MKNWMICLVVLCLISCVGCTQKEEMSDEQKVIDQFGLEPPVIQEQEFNDKDWGISYYEEQADGNDDQTDRRPTIPEDIWSGGEYMYDFTFDEAYDQNIDDEYGITVDPLGTMKLYEQISIDKTIGTVISGDGMTPYDYFRFEVDADKETVFVVGTHYYPLDELSYICYLGSNIQGAITERNVGVGSSMDEVLTVYPEDMYWMTQDEAWDGAGYFNDYTDWLPDYDQALMYQPMETAKDIMFYFKDDIVVAVETVSPYEARHVYGYDRETGKAKTEELRRN